MPVTSLRQKSININAIFPTVQYPTSSYFKKYLLHFDTILHSKVRTSVTCGSPQSKDHDLVDAILHQVSNFSGSAGAVPPFFCVLKELYRVPGTFDALPVDHPQAFILEFYFFRVDRQHVLSHSDAILLCREPCLKSWWVPRMVRSMAERETRDQLHPLTGKRKTCTQTEALFGKPDCIYLRSKVCIDL